MKKLYPVIFTQVENSVLIEVPDLKILTEGKSMENAIDMARDAISIAIVSMEDNNESVPTPSTIENIDVTNGTFADTGKSFVSLIDTNIEEYRRKVDTTPVRRNVSLPKWLNQEVSAAGINVSRVLQDALMEKLNIERRV